MSFGLVGLGAMGSNLACNITKKRNLYVHDVSKDAVISTIQKCKCNKYTSLPYDTLSYMIDSMQCPRNIVSLLPHGEITDSFLKDIIPMLDANDVILDCANEHYNTSSKRHDICNHFDINYIGVGISGGAVGALNGPSVMIGGNIPHYTYEFLNSFCNDVTLINDDPTSGHFIKMVHNGIEYGMLQAISDIWNFCGQDVDIMKLILNNSKNTCLNGFLINNALETLDIYNISKISSECFMNDTGTWCSQLAIENNIPFFTINSSIQTRINSQFNHSKPVEASYYNYYTNSEDIITIAVHVLQFVYASSILEGISLLSYKNISHDIAKKAWSGNTIINCDLLRENKEYITNIMKKHLDDVSFFVSHSATMNICIPAVSAAYQQYLSFNHNLGTNLLMAQRNLFGNHPFKQIDTVPKRLI